MNSSHADALTQLMDSASRLAATASESSRSEEGWTPTTILGHISDVDEQVWHARIRLMVDAHREGLAMPAIISWEPDASAMHDTFGALTVALVPEKILLHDEEHLESLR